MEIREATEHDDDLFVQRYLDDWATENWPEGQYYPDASARVQQFIQDKRARDELGGFVAINDNTVAGIIGYHLDFSPYPRVIQPPYLLLAYIWNVFVDPTCRGQGVGRGLIEHTANHLRSRGCSSIVLHHVVEARGFFEQLGFKPATELRRDL